MESAYREAADAPRLAREFLASQLFLRHLGMSFISAESGRCGIALPAREDLLQPDGSYADGVVSALASAAGGAAAHTLLISSAAMAIEFKVNFMAAGRGESLLARGHVIRAGKTLTVCRAEVFGVNRGEETPCATALMTLMAKAHSP
jgi:uncharacterized protein (TIGR00369 family)